MVGPEPWENRGQRGVSVVGNWKKTLSSDVRDLLKTLGKPIGESNWGKVVENEIKTHQSHLTVIYVGYGQTEGGGKEIRGIGG